MVDGRWLRVDGHATEGAGARDTWASGIVMGKDSPSPCPSPRSLLAGRGKVISFGAGTPGSDRSPCSRAVRPWAIVFHPFRILVRAGPDKRHWDFAALNGRIVFKTRQSESKEGTFNSRQRRSRRRIGRETSQRGRRRSQKQGTLPAEYSEYAESSVLLTHKKSSRICTIPGYSTTEFGLSRSGLKWQV